MRRLTKYKPSPTLPYVLSGARNLLCRGSSLRVFTAFAFVFLCACTSSETRLRAAASAGDVEGVKRFLADGARHDAKDTSGADALILATRAGHQAVVEVLFKSGASPNSKL